MGPAAGQFRALLWKNGLCRLRTPRPPAPAHAPVDQPAPHLFQPGDTTAPEADHDCRLCDRLFRSLPVLPSLTILLLAFALTRVLAARLLRARGGNLGIFFRQRDLNKAEEVVSKLERLQQQPHVWALLRSLPRLAAGGVPADDSVRSAGHLLRAVSKLLTSLEDLGWLPRDPTFARVSEIVLNVTISTLTFLQERGVAATELGYDLSLHSVVWDPRKAWADLKSRFGFDDLRAERGLSHSAELQEVARRWQDGGLQEALAEAGRRLQARTSQLQDGSPSRDVAEVLLAGLFLLNGSLAADGATGSPTSPDRLEVLARKELPDFVFIEVFCGLETLPCFGSGARWRLHFILGTTSSEASPCYEENMDWKVVSDNYFAFLNNILESPVASTSSFLELRARPWMSAEDLGWEVVLATLTGLKRRLSVDEDFRVSLFRYMNHLFNSSGEALLGRECFALDHKSVSFVNDSADGGAPFIFQWPQILTNLSANGSTFNEFAALRCAVSCLRMWAGVWSSVSQILKADANIFSALHVGLTRLLDELESDVNISKSCQGLCPTHRPATLIVDLFKNISRADGFQDWDAFLNLGDVWAALGEESVGVKSLNLGQIEKSLFTLEMALRQLQARPLNARASGGVSYAPRDVFAAPSDAPEDVDENVHRINHLLSKSLTRYGGKFESIVTDLRETMLFLRNVALDQDLASCAAMFQNVTEFISEDGLLYVNPLQRTLRILAVLKSTFSSEDSIRRLKGCAKSVDTINQLRMAYSPSFSQGRLQGLPRHFRDVENKINSTRKLVTWLLTIMESDCPLNKSNINCVNSFLKNVTDFLHVVLTAVLEKEKIPNSEILLTLLNDSTNHVRMIINNLTRDFEFASQSNWKHFIELILRPVEASDEIPSQFQHLWLHLVALGKEIKKLAEDISLNVLENNSSSKMETFLNTFAPSPKEKDINSFSNSVFHLASYLTFNLSHDLQNSPKIILHEIAKAVGLGVQVIRGVFDSLMPSTRHGTPGDPGSRQVLKKVTALLRAVRKPDLDLLVDQLEQVGDGLVDFFRNVSGLGTGTSGVSLLVGLMEKLVDSSHSWDVSHLLRLARLFPREDVNAAVDAFYALPQAARLLRGLADKNITGALQDVYDFTLLHGVRISGVTKEDFTAAIKALLDSVALVSEKPGVLAEALTCLPVLRCRNHTAAGFRQEPRFGACDRPESASSFFYGNVASVLERLRLSPPGEASWCSNETSRTELTRRVVCVVHGLVDWSSILLELFRVLRAETSLGESVREFWRKVLPSVPPSGLCPSGPLKHVALQIVEKLKNVNLTEVTSHENMFDKLAGLSKILNVNESTGASARGIPVNLGRIMKLLSGDRSLENSTQSLLSALTTFLNADRTGGDLDAFSSSTEQSAALYDLREPWPESEHITEDLNYDVKIRALLSDVNDDARMMTPVALQDVTLHLVQFLESLHSSAQALEITKDFLSVTKNWLCKYAKGDYARMIQTLCLVANESSTDDLALLAKDITTFLGYLEHIPREGDFDGALLSQLADPEEPANFSVVQSLLESFLINSINNLAGSSQEAAWSLSDSDLQIMNSINLALNRTQSERGEGITLPPGSRLGRVERLLKTFFFLQKERPANKTSPLGVVAEPR
ncbi:ATP-binding cassette sub-family A member 13 [Pteropus alecto]|uniref:ATP-binding cassette sub-family A member 13 n=1 Tax=Pteropus alecto TaxID=9402 RepID=L5KPD3_PTEAL|nr:ATP-binding cassette sub-family A member 13 [Pteropus alecto]